MRPTILTCSLGFFLASLMPAHAYLDPGTGSMILQATHWRSCSRFHNDLGLLAQTQEFLRRSIAA